MSAFVKPSDTPSDVTINHKPKPSAKKQKPSKKAIKIKIFDNKGKE
jgi:hypothetical protein